MLYLEIPLYIFSMLFLFVLTSPSGVHSLRRLLGLILWFFFCIVGYRSGATPLKASLSLFHHAHRLFPTTFNDFASTGIACFSPFRSSLKLGMHAKYL